MGCCCSKREHLNKPESDLEAGPGGATHIVEISTAPDDNSVGNNDPEVSDQPDEKTQKEESTKPAEPVVTSFSSKEQVEAQKQDEEEVEAKKPERNLRPSNSDSNKRKNSKSDPTQGWTNLPDDFIDRMGEIHIFNCTDGDITLDIKTSQRSKVEQETLNEIHSLYGERQEATDIEQARSIQLDLEAKSIMYDHIVHSKVPLLTAIEIQINRFKVNLEDFLELREFILKYIPEHLPLRKHTGMDGWRSHCRTSGRNMEDFSLFGRPRGYLETGPDVAIIMAALNIGTAEEPYAPLATHDESNLLRDIERVLNAPNHVAFVLGKSHFGAVLKVNHDYQELCVKVLEKSRMRHYQDIFNDYAPSEVQHHRYLCSIDKNAKYAKYPSPYITRFIKIIKEKSSQNYMYAMELGKDILSTVGDSKVICFKAYDKYRTRFLKDNHDTIKNDLTWTRRNESPWESEKKRTVLEIAFGIFFMHQRGCSHNDIKANNAMLGADDKRGKLMDFGQTFRYSKNEREHMWCNHKNCGAPKIRSPEAYFLNDPRCPLNIPDRSRFSARKNDVWCLGISMYRMILMLDPFRERNNLADCLFLYLTAGSYLTDEQRKKQREKVLAVIKDSSKRRELGVYFTDMKDGEVDYDLGIFKICKAVRRDPDKVARQRHLLITEKCVRLLHRVFVPEEQRLSVTEFILDPYFDDIRDQVVNDMQQWQQERFGDHDDLSEIFG